MRHSTWPVTLAHTVIVGPQIKSWSYLVLAWPNITIIIASPEVTLIIPSGITKPFALVIRQVLLKS